MKTIDNQAYKNNPNKCPSLSCRSDDIEGGSVNIDGSVARQDVSCKECGLEWFDEYRLESYCLPE